MGHVEIDFYSVEPEELPELLVSLGELSVDQLIVLSCRATHQPQPSSEQIEEIKVRNPKIFLPPQSIDSAA
jgi:hypothetical protein